jgi:ABC-2 type transport system ATP-binding protein
MEPIVQVQGLRKTYGKTIAVDDISFEIEEGEIFGMVGPNGAGKTTTTECIEGLRAPDKGRLRVLGFDPITQERILRPLIGTQLQSTNLPNGLKVWESLDLYASFYPNPINWSELIDQLGLDEKRDTHFRKLSGGQKQRLFIALALVNDPKLVFFDELTTGLDPQARHVIWDLVRDVRQRGKTVFLTTHSMEEAERLCDRVAIMDHGKIVALDTPGNLIRSIVSETRISLTVDDPADHQAQLQERLAALTAVKHVEQSGDQFTIYGREAGKYGSSHLLIQVVEALASQEVAFRDLHSDQPDLEDVFLALTGQDIRD